MSKRHTPGLDRPICPATLGPAAPGSYSTLGLKDVFAGRKVSPQLSLKQPTAESTEEDMLEHLGRLSLSGMQEKYALIQDGRSLRLTVNGERGTHILKPIVDNKRLNRVEAMPANEHLSMQVAKQVFGINTAACAIVQLTGGELAYLTRRFDYRADGTKYLMEDFAGLSGRSPQTHGKDYKYAGNYLVCFTILKRTVAAYRIEAERLLTLLLFNYLIGNADAHLKNFSIIETDMGDHRLSPAYDLLNTEIHIASEPFALSQGLLPPEHAGGKVREEFEKLAELADLPTTIVDRFIARLPELEAQVQRLVEASFLPPASQRQWLQFYQGRQGKLER